MYLTRWSLKKNIGASSAFTVGAYHKLRFNLPLFSEFGKFSINRFGRMGSIPSTISLVPGDNTNPNDIYQFCWEWCIENLRAGKYNSQTSLYGYLEIVCKNKIKKLRRDKQWRTDISDQNACRKCKHRDTCERKVTYADLETVPKCKVMKAALERNYAKHTLSVQADYDLTEPACHRNHHGDVEIAELMDFFGKQIPEIYKPVLQRLLHGNITGIPKKTIITARRWCWKALRKIDVERAEQFQRIYYNAYQKESRCKERLLKKQGVVKEKRHRRQPVIVSDDDIRAVHKPGMSIGKVLA